MRIHPVGVHVFHKDNKRMNRWMGGWKDRQTDRQMNMKKPKVAFHSFVNTPKNSNSNPIQLLGKSKESGNNTFFPCTM